MRRSILYAGMTLVCLFACTGCFDLEEYLLLRKDGSGRFSFVVNLSKMMAMAQVFETETDKKQEDESEKLNTTFERSRRKIELIPGISNYQEVKDTVAHRYGFIFEFSDLRALNKALNHVFASDTTRVTDHTFFDLNGRQLRRLDPTDVQSLVSGQTGTPQSRNSGGSKSVMNFDKVFADINYTTTYEIEQGIDSAMNVNSLLDPAATKITLTCQPFARDSASMACTLKNTIFLK